MSKTSSSCTNMHISVFTMVQMYRVPEYVQCLPLYMEHLP